jgi:hypothetical protein
MSVDPKLEAYGRDIGRDRLMLKDENPLMAADVFFGIIYHTRERGRGFKVFVICVPFSTFLNLLPPNPLQPLYPDHLVGEHRRFPHFSFSSFTRHG